MKRILLALLLTIAAFTAVNGYQIIPENVTIGEQKKPDPSASLELRGTGRGLLINRLTSTQRDAIVSPATGLVIFNTTAGIIEYYNGTTWAPATGGRLTDWITANPYVIGDIVVDSGKIYRALSSHTSGATFGGDFLGGKWEILSGGIKPTGTSTDNALVRFDGVTGDQGQTSSAILDDAGNLSGLSSLVIGGTKDASSIMDMLSTTKGTRPCPLMTTTQRNALSSPADGLCIYNTTQGKLNIYNATASTWKSAGGGLEAWATGFAYSVGDTVHTNSKIYVALSAHTSGTFATDLGAGKWSELSVGVTDHTLLTNIGTNTHAQIDSHIANTSNPHSVTKAQVGLGNVDNTSDATKNSAVATLTNKTIDGLSNTLTNITATTNANLTGDVTSVGNATTLTNAPVIAKVLTGFTSGAGTIAATDSILSAFQKADGNTALKVAKSTLTTKGDTYVATGASTVVRQAVGSDGQTLLADSGQTNGIRWGYEYERNYITNPGAETDTTGWANFSTTFTNSVPAALTGGSPVTNIARTTSSPLNDSGSFLFSKTGTTSRSGEGFSYAFTINSADTSKVLRIDFNYSVTTNYADNDMTCWIHDGTSMIQPSAYQLKKNTGIEPATMEFQATTSTSYRFGCVISSSSALDYDVKFDKFKIWRGPKAYVSPVAGPFVQSGMTITGTVSAPTKGTVVTDKIIWYRDGSRLVADYQYEQSAAGSATGSGEYLFQLPAGQTFDANYVQYFTGTVIAATSSQSFGKAVVGWGSIGMGASSGYNGNALLIAYDSTHFRVYTMYANSTTLAGTGTMSSGGNIGDFNTYKLGFNFRLDAPISGWQSNVQSSDQADTRVIALNASSTASQTTSSTFTTWTVPSGADTHGAFNATTGIYTVPVAGFYDISFNFVAGTGTTSFLQCNISAGGTTYSGPWFTSGASIGSNCANTVNVKLNAGQTISVLTGGGATSGAGTAYLSIKKVSGPSQIQSSETVSASYWLSANFAASTTTPINFDSKEWDSTGALVTPSSTVWKFTAPISGVYLVTGSLSSTATSFNAVIYKNGSAYKPAGFIASAQNGILSAKVKLLAGEYMDIRPSGSATIVGGTLATSSTGNVTITRVGNY